jgi:hypothetical protein
MRYECNIRARNTTDFIKAARKGESAWMGHYRARRDTSKEKNLKLYNQINFFFEGENLIGFVDSFSHQK